MTTTRNPDRTIDVCDFEDWMLPQLLDLFVAEYGGAIDSERMFFERFYGHQYQRNRAIQLVALDGQTVVGFQSLFFWPYRQGTRIYRSFQSGRSLVAPSHRGRGIFSRLLDHLDANRERYGCDFLMGFPVEASVGSFRRNGWSNILDLSWFVRPLNPLAYFSPRKDLHLSADFDELANPIPDVQRQGVIELAEDQAFLEWRRQFAVGAGHRAFHYREHGETVRIDCKLNRRGRVTELIIGAVRRSTDRAEIIERAIRAFLGAARSGGGIVVVSIALNENIPSYPLSRVVRSLGFFRIRPKIYFIVKDYGAHPEVAEPSSWMLFRADIDTW